MYDTAGHVRANLSEKHERVVGSEVLGEELHAVTLQSRNSVLLGCIQSRHHSLWTDMDLVRIQEPVQRKERNMDGQASRLVYSYSEKWKTLILMRY